MGLGKATLIHAPAAAWKLLQRPFPTASAVSNACQAVFGEDAAVLAALEVQVRDLDASLLGGAFTEHWRRGVCAQHPFSPAAAREPVVCESLDGDAGALKRGTFHPLALLRPWLKNSPPAEECARRLEQIKVCRTHAGPRLRRQLALTMHPLAQVAPARSNERSHSRPAHEGTARGVAPWRIWAVAGFRLLPEGGALDRRGVLVPEEQLEHEAVALSLPWPVPRPSESAVDELLTIEAPSTVCAAAVKARAVAAAKASRRERDASAAPGDARPCKKRKIDLRVGRVVWLREPPPDAPPMPMVILAKVDERDCAPGAGDGLRLGPLPTPPGPIVHPGTLVPRAAVVEFGDLLPTVWLEHGDAPGVHTAVEAALKQMHMVCGQAREPRSYWQRFGPGVPYPF